MAAGDLSLMILISAQNQAASVIRSIASDLGPVGTGMAAIGIGAVVAGAEAVKMAGNFQQAMLSLVAHAGLAQSQFDKVSQSVMQMSSEVGRSPTQLAEALYPILSAFSGIQNQAAKSSIALDTLRMSFQTVAGTTTDGTAVANAAVGTFNALGLATNNVSTNTQRMTGLFDVMDKTVMLGNMQWNAYKNVVSKLAVAIQGTGITFNESQAALAEMTNEGFTAQRASTYLANTFTTLAIKTDALAGHAKKLKIPFNESAYAGMDLAHKIEYLNQVTDGNKQKLLALMGNNTTALKTFNALSTGIGGYKSNLDALNHSQGALQSSFDTAKQGLNFHLQQAKAAFDALMITLGTKLIPIVTSVVGVMTSAISSFTQWVTSGNNLANMFEFLKPLLMAIGIVILGTVVPALWSLAAGVIAATWPVLLIIAAIAGVIAIFKHWYDTNAGFKAFIDNIVTGFKNLWSMIQANFIPIMQRLGAFFQSTILPVLKQIGSFIVGTFKPAWDQLVVTWKQNLLPGLEMLWGLLQKLWPVLRIIGIVLIASVVVPILAVIAVLVLIGVAIMKFVALLIQGWGLAISFTGKAFSAIGTTITNFKNLVGNIFNAIGTFIHDKLTWIYNHNYYVKAFVDLVMNFLHNLQVGVTAVFNFIKIWISQKLAEVQVFVINFKNALGDQFNQLGTNIHNAVTSAWNWLQGFVSGWPSQAVQWGINLIQGFINGIGSMLGGVQQAAQNVISTVGHFLGFHSPAKEGEGRYIIQWGEGMVTGFVQGMKNKMPLLNANVAHMISAPNIAYAGSSLSLAHDRQMNVTVQLDSRKMMQALGVRQAKEVRIQGNYRNA